MKKLFNNEIFSYLFFGVLTTLVYLSIRFALFEFLKQTALHSAVIANMTAIVFAFLVNDTFVFRQNKQGWQARFVKFFLARLGTLAIDVVLAYLFIDKYPQLIGQFVNHDLAMVNKIESVIAQFLIVVGNYFISKLLIFTNKK